MKILFPYLINDASLANSETTLLPIVFSSVYFNSAVTDATVANAVLLLPFAFIRVDTLLPLPSLRCFGERITDEAVAPLMFVGAFATESSCLSTVVHDACAGVCVIVVAVSVSSISFGIGMDAVGIDGCGTTLDAVIGLPTDTFGVCDGKAVDGFVFDVSVVFCKVF